MRKALALIRANWLTAFSYRLQTFFNLLSIFVTLVPVYFISKALQPMMANVIKTEATDYFGFLMMGLITFMLIQSAVTALHGALSGEISTGSFEALLGTPTSILSLLAGLVGQSFSMTLLRTLVTFLFSAWFGLHVVWSSAPAALFVLALLVLAYLPFGIIAAALILAFRTTGPFPNGVLTVSVLLGGVYYPTQAIPSWLQQGSVFIPLTYGLRALRRSFLDGAPLSSSAGDLTVLVGVTAVMFVVSLFTFALALRYAKHAGTLAQY